MRHAIISLLIFLLLGAIVNVAVAWGCVLWLQFPCNPQLPESPQVMWRRYVHSPKDVNEIRVDSAKGGIGSDLFTLAASGQVSGNAPHVRITRAGLPMDSVECMNGWGTVHPKTSWGLPIEPRNPNTAWISVLPLRPIWPGFLLNSILYAVVVWLILFGIRSLFRGVLRWNRISLDRCPKCAYPIGESEVCTECGNPLPVSRIKR